MRYLGIDFGAKNVGIALSDVGGTLATPHDTFLNDLGLIVKIWKLSEKEGISEIIVGDTRNLAGADNKISALLDFFVADLIKITGLPVVLEKEYFTSHEAHGREGKESNNARKTTKSKTANVDSKAAAIILQRFLDKRNKRR